MKIVLLTGYSCAGKSTIAQYLNKEMNFSIIAYHDTLRAITRSKGYSRTREWIFDVGIEKVVEEARNAILNELEIVKSIDNKNILIDGLYDNDLLFKITQKYKNGQIITIAILSNKENRILRTMERELMSKDDAINELEFIDDFKDKVGVNEVIKSANIIINNDVDIEKVFSEIQYSLTESSSGSFGLYLEESARSINLLLDDYLNKWANNHFLEFKRIQPLLQAFIDNCRGGKRIRSVLVKLGYEIANGFHNDTIYSVAIAYELFQSAMLIHDDIIDESPLRRGKPTLHKVLERRCAEELYKTERAQHYGISQSICIGDIALSLAIKLISDSTFDLNLKNKATSSFIQTIVDTGFGQMLDVELPYLERELVDEADIMTVFKYKTAHYTISGPLQLGAMLAGASQSLLDAISVFGDNLGIAFQIKDDILGIFSEEKVIGKSVTSDIEEGKNTLLFLYAIRKANNEQKDFLLRHYGSGKVPKDIHDKFKEIFIETGAKIEAEKVMRKFVDKAIGTIGAITDNEIHLKYLQDLTYYMIYRIK